tara:strand:- start:4520 stop:4852 length:333 start_codon:yes stop_codon:yes gene_type:complete
MSAWKASPPIMQHMVVFLRAHLECDKLVCGRPWRRLAPRNEIWPRSPYGILDHVGYEERKDHADEPAEDRDVRFVGAGADEDGPEDKDSEGDCTSVDEEPCLKYSQRRLL